MFYESINIPLWRALREIRGKAVLDVGCGTGALGELLQQNGNTVEGITWSAEEARIAAARLAKVYVFDLNSAERHRTELRRSYDMLVFADVLEHLLAPRGTLAALLPLLSPGGKVYVSLPNIACFHVRLGLLCGGFEMSKSGGALDETHLHFYTLKTARELLRGADLEIEKVDFVPAPSVWFYQAFLKKASSEPPERMAGRKDFRFYERWVYPLEHLVASAWRTLLAQQFVFVCRSAAEKPGGAAAG
ncbi:MAG: class I SAM-dependent methyltransferase [Planctomycetota bacterium]